MVARLVWDQDAAGSNPVTSTRKNRSNMRFFLFVFDFVFAFYAEKVPR